MKTWTGIDSDGAAWRIELESAYDDLNGCAIVSLYTETGAPSHAINSERIEATLVPLSAAEARELAKALVEVAKTVEKSAARDAARRETA
jgi:hypothetical protein